MTWSVNDEHDQVQAGAMVERIDGFESTGQHVDFGALVDDDSGEQDETAVGATVVAHDVCKEYAAEFVSAKETKGKY